MSHLAIFAVASLCVVMLNLESTSAIPSPIVLIPGITGSQLIVKDNRFNHCYTFGKYHTLWAPKYKSKNPKSWKKLLCLVDELALRYDYKTKEYSQPSKIKVKVRGTFGDTKPVEYLRRKKQNPYMNTLVDYFVDRGYERGKSIRAAPYDWRLAPDMLEKKGYYDKLKKLIEDTYTTNGETKVTLVVHSMGGPVSLYFLTGFESVTQEWKDKYINAWVTLSGAWSGGVKTLQTIISGKSSKSKIRIFRKMERVTYGRISRKIESSVWLLPGESVWGNTTLVTIGKKKYSAKDYKELFARVWFKSGYDKYKAILPINKGYPAPNVKTYCYYGVGVKTTEQLQYNTLRRSKIFFRRYNIAKNPKIFNGDGDGTVNTKSSEVCLKWGEAPNSQFSTQTFSEVTHTGIVKDTSVLDKIAEIACWSG